MFRKTILTLVLFLFVITAFSFAVDVQFAGPVILNPSPANVGQSVQVRANFYVPEGGVTNLKLICKINNAIVMEKFYPQLNGPSSYIKAFTWTAAHSTTSPRMPGQPSNVKVEFILDPDNSVTDEDRSNNVNIGYLQVKEVMTLNTTPGTVTTATLPGKISLGPCYDNQNGTTDLHPIDMTFTKIGWDKFRWRVNISNEGPRCVKSVKWELWYFNHTTSQVLKLQQGEIKPNKKFDWAIEANKVAFVIGTFERDDVPGNAYIKHIDSSVQEIDYEIEFWFKIDTGEEVPETNENNNNLFHWHKWTET